MDAYKCVKKGGLKLKKKDDEKATKSSSGPKKKPATYIPQEGRVVTVGTTVQGFETRFVETIQVGDIIALTHPTTNLMEERRVASILSQRTLTVDEPFTSDIASTTNFFKRTLTPTELGQDFPKEKKSKLVLREKVGTWSYRTRVEELDRHLTSAELLDLRIKRVGRDKFC